MYVTAGYFMSSDLINLLAQIWSGLGEFIYTIESIATMYDDIFLVPTTNVCYDEQSIPIIHWLLRIRIIVFKLNQ